MPTHRRGHFYTDEEIAAIKQQQSNGHNLVRAASMVRNQKVLRFLAKSGPVTAGQVGEFLGQVDVARATGFGAARLRVLQRAGLAERSPEGLWKTTPAGNDAAGE